MPQLFQVLRCYKCFVFQVHQTKKSSKWECKLCGEKQSIKRHYGLGTAKDCRQHVQKLNGMRGEIDQLKNSKDLESDNSESEENVTQPLKDNYKPIKDSKWSNYIDETKTVDTVETVVTNENMSLGDTQVVLELPKKKRKRNINIRNPKVTPVDHGKTHKNYENHIDSDMTPDIVPNNVVNIVNIQSKKLQQGFQSENLLTKEPITKINNLKNKFIPSALNKNSKWAQFTEDEETEKSNIAPSPSRETSQNDLMFSLCDNTDLDNVLNI